MLRKSLFKVQGVIFAGLVIFLTVLLPALESPNVQGAEPLAPPQGFDIAPGSIALGKGWGAVGNARSPRVASRHILVKLSARTDEKQFLQHAKGRGMNRQGRVYGSKWLVMSIPEGADSRQAAAAARTLPGVLRATPDYIVRINDQIPPRDPFYKDDDDPTTKPCDPLLELCDPSDLVDQWGLFKTEAEGGWIVQRGSSEIVIAILDSGMDLDHDDVWDNIWTNLGEIPDNGIDDDVNGFVDDVHGADFCGNNVGDPLDDPTSQDPNPDIPTGGTWVEDLTAWPFGIRFAGDPAVGDAVDNDLDQLIDLGVFHGTFAGGVAGAMTDNINPDSQEFEGMAGVCWHCKLMPVRLINAEGWAFGSDAAAAVYYAADMGADVINVSWGIDVNSADPSLIEEIQVLSEAIDYAVSLGVIVVAAAGNSGTAGLHFPARMTNTIAVGASNWLDQRSDFSTFAALGEIPDNGIDDDGNGWVDDALDVVAPGELIWSSAVLSAYDALLYDFLGMVGWEPGSDTYGQADGTSFSTPLVSGYVGLILSQNPGATLSQVREVIRSNAADILDPNGVGESLEGYDAYSGFGRIRMVVPSLSPYYVDDDYGNPPPGSGTPTDPFHEIQMGINAASSGDTVQVAAGVYYENITMKGGVVVQGAGQGVAIIDGGGSGSVVTASFVDPAPKLEGFSIQNGNSGYGGGMYIWDSSPMVTNCTFSGNTAASYGGGMYMTGSSPTMTNCTFSGNTADQGGGMYNTNSSSPTVTNSILWGNSPNQISNSGGSVVNITYSDIKGGWGGMGNIDTDPLFVGYGDFHLLPNSPCIDAGDPNAPALPLTDFEGDPRIIGSAPDMGADEAPCPVSTYYRDADGDGYGNPSESIPAPQDCSQPAGCVEDNADCDDNDANEHPNQTWYKDADKDGYSDGTTNTASCTRPAGYKVESELTATSGDCDDSDPSLHPGANEVCNGIDEDCDGLIDEDAGEIYYRDADDDGYGDPTNSTQTCSQPAGYVINDLDCDDTDPLEHPGQTWYKDFDNDGYSDGTVDTISCTRPAGYKVISEVTAIEGDCNDTDPTIHPGATEVCNGKDDNCDGEIDEGCLPPGKATLISPAGTTDDNTPTYSWNAVETATWYYLWVNDSTGTNVKKWYRAGDANCSDGTGECSVTHTTVLADGSCKWWIQTWNDYGYGPWSDAVSFTVDTGEAPPVAATLISPSGTITENNPTYTWNAVENSTWYYLWVNDSTGNKIKKWYRAGDANCSDGTGECSVTHTTVLADGSCKWWIQTWNDYGYGPWSDAVSFTVDTGTAVPPGAATLISPIGAITDNTPTYSWEAAENATWYYLWVDDSTGNKIKKWYRAEDAGCSSGTGECSVTPTTVLADGAANWWIQTWNQSGYGPWSSATTFSVSP